MSTPAIDLGFDDTERDRVGLLYWEAFRRKLRPAFARTQLGTPAVAALLRPDRVIVARRRSDVIGVCGFYEGTTGAMDLDWLILRRHLSFAGALRAGVVLSLLSRTSDPNALVLDGICVDADARGLGIGSALLDAAKERARRIGASAVRLSVVDSNPRARALYERHGFVPVRSSSMGLLAPVYGFDTYTTMESVVHR
ncbi:GNAT family N-acetyltransferase [Microbacterium sp. PMB16]|uniref:GNAT family N-acetyltransferase n=1 Tax=Microbacterium sp. PMB16 TaxID=3120157 RepID=UPI003F4AFD69